MVEGFRAKSMELRWIRRSSSKTSSQIDTKLLRRTIGSTFPIYISTDPRHIDPHELQQLYADCNHSCYRFPNYVDSHGRVEPVDIHKLRVALSHSAVLVSVFCKPHNINVEEDDGGRNFAFAADSSSSILGMTDFLQSVTPVSPVDGQLVGFGRAVSDCGLTASIYDVMVIPSLRRIGIGQLIVKKIVRMLTNRDIYDISALCAENERLFFKACGFGGDILSSTTMMYTRASSSTTQEGEYNVRRAGRKLLLVPPLKGPCKSSRTII
ncbi:acetyltransferase NSI [Senna tora]|uniref:Acetyltransferase NSI n=1 Tax=Senna tora TaxID=362788 RepID=A0A834T7F6_9FABA|nr:acetyltransferase NSI [Senna tora]